MASAIGGDALGQEAAGTLDGKRVTHLLQRVDFPTGTVQVELDARGVPRYDIRTGVAWDNIPYTDALDALAERTRAVCFGSLAQRSPVSRETIARFLDRMPDDGDRYRIFDINLRQDFYTKEVIERSLDKCNVLKINDEELVIVNRLFGYPGIDLQDTCRTLIARYGLRYLILTLGANGSYVFPQHGKPRSARRRKWRSPTRWAPATRSRPGSARLCCEVRQCARPTDWPSTCRLMSALRTERCPSCPNR